MCGTTFYGRTDARYCGGACRQKAYRAAAARRAVDQTLPAPLLGSTIAQARQTRQGARQTRQEARATRTSAAAMRRASAQARAGRGSSASDDDDTHIHPARRGV